MDDLQKCIEKAIKGAYISDEYEEDEDDECEHKWVFQRSDFSKRTANDILIEYRRIDTYYCEKCLETKEIVAKEEIFPNTKEYKNDPYWFNPMIRIQRF